MPLFQKKPVVVEAHQWFVNGDHPYDESYPLPTDNGSSFLTEGKIVRYYRHPTANGFTPCGKCKVPMHQHGWIDTLEGGHIVCPGDWIILGVQGEMYPCKPDIFEATYECVAK